MIQTAVRTLRVLLAGWKYEVAAAAQYRSDILLGTLVTTIWMGIVAAPVLIVGLHVYAASGWTLGRLLFCWRSGICWTPYCQSGCSPMCLHCR